MTYEINGTNLEILENQDAFLTVYPVNTEAFDEEIFDSGHAEKFMDWFSADEASATEFLQKVVEHQDASVRGLGVYLTKQLVLINPGYVTDVLVKLANDSDEKVRNEIEIAELIKMDGDINNAIGLVGLAKIVTALNTHPEA